MTPYFHCPTVCCLLLLSLASVSAVPNGIIFGAGPTRRPVTVPTAPSGPVRCRDPQNQLGTCVRFNQCPELRKYATERNVAYLKASVCHRAGKTILLCCPDSAPPPTEKPTAADTAFKSHPDCGLSNFGPPGRIVGGEPVQALDDLPWMTALGYANVQPEFKCGGAVIAPRWILTAAHCITKNGPSHVRVGDLNLFSEREDDFLNPPQNVDVERVFRHPDFKRLPSRALINDIALLKLEKPIKFSEVVRPICVPELAGRSAVTDREVMIAGWGLTSFQGEVPDTMLYANVNMSLPGFCTTAYRRAGVSIDEDKHMCASGNDLKNLLPGCTVADVVDKPQCRGGVDTCSGDSGGPLMLHRRLTDNARFRFRAEAVGVVSFAIGCGDPRHPGVYTRVSTYLDWMGRTVGDNSS